MAFTVYDAVFGSAVLRQCQSANYDPDASVVVGRSGAGIDPAAIYGGEARPKANWRCFDLAGVLAVVSPYAGFCVNAGSIEIPYAERAVCGTLAGSDSHIGLSASNGLLVITSLGAQQGESGSVELVAHFRSTTGLADPVTKSTGNSLGAHSHQSQFGLGPVAVNGSEIGGVVGWTANTGITVEAEIVKGHTYPTSVYIKQREPSIEITFRDSAAAAAFDTYTDLTNCACYLRRRAAGGTFVADATASHVKASFAGGLVKHGGIQASSGESGTASIMLHGEQLSITATNAIA